MDPDGTSQRAGVPHIDETSFRPKGKTARVRILDPAACNALFAIRTIGGRDVLEDVMPESE